MTENSYEFREKMADRLLEFSVKIIKLEKILCKTYSGKHIFEQLFRAGSSSGANFEESIGAESKADFIHKTQVVLKEIRESNFWLRLIKKAGLIPEIDNDFNFLLSESFEFKKIFSKSIVTAKQNKK